MIIYDKQLLALGQKYIKMKLYVQMLVNTECETHPFIPNLQGFFGFVLLLAFSRK